MPAIIEAVHADLITDLTSSQILGWMQRVQPLTPEELSAETINGRPAMLYDDLARMRLDFWQPDPADLRVKVRWLISGTLPPAATP